MSEELKSQEERENKGKILVKNTPELKFDGESKMVYVRADAKKVFSEDYTNATMMEEIDDTPENRELAKSVGFYDEEWSWHNPDGSVEKSEK
ncbi:MAG: hypothetical protein A2312_00670 [Candidatus Staskawiczbacteria bacterium RIFOXYB2_FULL_32_9]|uniref:Uncharacterized protein n=1 Tax=Candidatus Staskawiczbacteria bacterium RIFOXYD1_FULL_32_13 TaxID=1802234 RepID=A0A1G2JME4_9BACT|nr:MAG: hypothetical protein UR22_C0004G0007 [Parcubacteria group bacterium GW2011_GWC2_32_10]OGZ79284.1 MAG: hypothetical protein A2360_01165 [Candidatus Staskawiczbacteria bacterium RIFOXYB1_FULL_32_11]OGZ79825.1 MAG: hypothetical protein A2256_02590 [Candidatus Staskawiczbacteria bacterium RIFOXYA2_FULL_32_7]OGZ84590.1 MAG: hypothetical protein A2312_00670 [Candidatus Staskawiczbacteria bacterium RIFOXYB2_FULL_32_9]OGZ88027.1 MAG: hypothetical protein A2463_00250 [Candidatus Staskawiczbacter